MKRNMLTGALSSILFCLFVSTTCHAQPGDTHKKLTDFEFKRTKLVKVNPLNGYRNINHATAKNYQDYKRAVFFITRRGNKSIHTTAFLVNTASQNQKPYMITAACFFGLESKVDYEKEVKVSITPNYEIPNAEEGGATSGFEKIWQTKIKLLVLDRNANIALFEVLDPNGSKGEVATYLGLYNAYALGWDIRLPEEIRDPNVLKEYVNANIAFPNNHSKKILLNPVSASYNFYDSSNSPITFKRGEAYQVNWGNDVKPNPTTGSYGSPLFNNQGQVIGIHTGPGFNWNETPPTIDDSQFLYTALRNSWQYQKRMTNTQGEITQPAGLIDYLDPHKTYVTQIPGGYWADLNPIAKPNDDQVNEAFVYTHTNAPSEKRLTLATDYPLTWRNIQGDLLNPPTSPFGIRLNSNKLVGAQNLLLYATTIIGDKEYLVWAVEADSYTDPDATTKFYTTKLKFDDNPLENKYHDRYNVDRKFADLEKLGLDESLLLLLESNDLENYMMQLAVKRSAVEGRTINYKTMTLPVNVYLSRLDAETSPIPITAWGIPGRLPENLNQQQNSETVKKAFTSKKYKPLTPTNGSNELYIDFMNFTEESNSTVNGSFRRLLTIIGHPINVNKFKSGNNGGYLNMVNPLIYIKDVVCTYAYRNDDGVYVNKIKKMRITSTVRSNETYNYKIWIDYNQDHRFYGYYNNNHDIPELIASGSLTMKNKNSTNIDIVDYTLPNHQDLDIGYGEKKAYRLRVAVSTGTIPEQPADDDDPWAMPNGEVEDYLIVLKGLSTEEIEAEQQAKDKDIANQRQGKRGRKRDHPDENPDDTADDQRNQHIQDLAYDGGPSGFNADTRVPIMAIVDNGKLPQVLSPLLVRMEDILTLAYQRVVRLSGSGPNDPPIGDESCSGSPLPNDQFPGYDPNDAASWQHWARFNSLYHNIARIIRFWDNLHLDVGGTPISFIENDAESYAIWNALVQAYNLSRFLNEAGNIDLEAFQDEHGVFSFTKWQDAVNAYFAEGGPLANVETIYDLLYLVYSNDTLMNRVFEEEADTYRQLFEYILKFQCFKEQVIEASNTLEIIYDFTKNKYQILVDYLGQVLNKFSEFRELTHEFVLKDLPDAFNQMAVVWQAKGESNATFIGIDSQGYIVYEVKNGNEVKTITASVKLREDDDVALDARFVKGEMELDINGALKQSTESFLATTHGFANFLAVGNGASFGAPLSNTTEPIYKTINGVQYELVPLDALWENTLFTGNNTGQQQRLSSTATKGINTINVSKDMQQTQTDANAFQIFPNPTDGELNILVEVQEAGPLQINIFDLTGRLVYENEEAEIDQGQQRITLKDIKLIAGQYIVKVTAGNVTQSEIVTFE